GPSSANDGAAAFVPGRRTERASVRSRALVAYAGVLSNGEDQQRGYPPRSPTEGALLALFSDRRISWEKTHRRPIGTARGRWTANRLTPIRASYLPTSAPADPDTETRDRLPSVTTLSPASAFFRASRGANVLLRTFRRVPPVIVTTALHGRGGAARADRRAPRSRREARPRRGLAARRIAADPLQTDGRDRRGRGLQDRPRRGRRVPTRGSLGRRERWPRQQRKRSGVRRRRSST